MANLREREARREWLCQRAYDDKESTRDKKDIRNKINKSIERTQSDQKAISLPSLS